MKKRLHMENILSGLLCAAILFGGFSLQAQTPAPVAGELPAAPLPEIIPAVTDKLAAANTPEPAAKIKSLFFSPEEIIAIRSAVVFYQNRHPVGGAAPSGDFIEDLLPKEPLPPANQLYTYPQFFLQSLVYHSPKDWVVWINDQKISPDTSKKGTDLSVESIDANKVTFIWHPAAADKNKVALSLKAPINNVTIDTLDNSVQFTLRTNQTFSSYVMRVLEGKVLPVTVEAVEAPIRTVTPAIDNNATADKPVSGFAVPPSNVTKEEQKP